MAYMPLQLLNTLNMPGQIGYKHPDYIARQWWWEFYRVSYVGGREYYRPNNLSVEFQFPVISGGPRNEQGQIISTGVVNTDSRWYESLLFRHNREKEWEFENRRKRAYYYNFVASVINALVSHTLQKKPTRDGDALLSEFWEGADRTRRLTIDNCVRRGITWAQVYGIYWAVVDVRTPEEGGDGRPSLEWVAPQDIWDWSVDEYGEIEWLKQFVYLERPRNWTDEVRPVINFKIWYRDRVETIEVDPKGGQTLLNTRPIPIGRVPFEPVYSKRSEDCLFPDGIPVAGDLSKIANHVFNLASLLNEILYKQTFSQLIIPTGGNDLDVIQAGTNTFFGYNSNGQTGEPKYISPDPDQARVLSENIGSAMELARQVAGVGRGRSDSSKEQASGAALELESDDKRAILTTIAREAEDFELRIAHLVSQWRMVQTTEKPYIQYEREFNLRSYQSEISEVLSLQKVGFPVSFETRLKKDLATKRYASLPPDEMKEILADIEDFANEMEEKRSMEKEAMAQSLKVNPIDNQK